MILRSNTKGMVLLLDVFIATMLLTLFITIYIQSVPVQQSFSSTVLYGQGSDILLELERQNLFSSSIELSDTSAVEVFLNTYVSEQFCMNVSTFTSSQTQVYTVATSDCSKSTNNPAFDVGVVYTSFLALDSIYYTKAEVWLR